METKLVVYCRTCLRQDVGYRKLDEFYSDNLRFDDLLIYLLNCCESSAVLPTFLCKECEEYLIQAYFFKKQCLESEKRFLKTNLIDMKIEIVNENGEILEEIKAEDPLRNETVLEDNGRGVPEDVCREQSQGEYLNDSMSSRWHYCRKCNLKFTSRKDYNYHYQKNHREKCACPECGKVVTLQSLKRHQARHYQTNELKEIPNEVINFLPTPYGCRKCCIQFKTRLEYTMHYEKCHRKKRIRMSKQINHNKESFEEDKDKVREEFVNSSKSYDCRKCDVKYTTRKEYSRHYKQEHSELLVCPQCGKLVKQHSLSAHQKFHDKTKRPVCNECGKSFSGYTALKFHLRIHTGDCRYECEYCNEKFIHLSSKKSHIQTYHAREKNFECHICGNKFGHITNFKRHMLIHTGNKRHQCTFCSKMFYTLTSMKNHLLVHTKEKNYCCKICSKAFGTNRYLTIHMKTHTRNHLD